MADRIVAGDVIADVDGPVSVDSGTIAPLGRSGKRAASGDIDVLRLVVKLHVLAACVGRVCVRHEQKYTATP